MLPSSATAYKQLTDFQKTRKNSQQQMDIANQKYDVTGVGTRVSKLRGLVGNLENAVEAVDPQVTGRTSGSLVTEAQRGALVNRERAPILSDLGKQQQAFGQAQGDWTMANQLSGEYARNLMSEDQQRYQVLTDLYGKSVAAEAAAEEKRRWEAEQARQREALAAEERRFQAQLAESRAARLSAGGGGYGLGGGSSAAPTIQDQAYSSVQKYLNAGRAAAQSDYWATLDSANRGNAMDKLKIQLYNQNGINGGKTGKTGSVGGWQSSGLGSY